MLDGANHAMELASDARTELEQLWDRHRADSEKKPDATQPPAEWTGAAIENELRALAKRIVELPQSSVAELMWFVTNVNGAKLNEQRDENDVEPSQITVSEIRALLAKDIRPEHVSAFWWLKHEGAVTLAADDDRSPTPDELHEMTVPDIREQYPDADEQEVKLRVAISESISMTPDEQDQAYELISAAVEQA